MLIHYCDINLATRVRVQVFRAYIARPCNIANAMFALHDKAIARIKFPSCFCRKSF